jgi:hypothetical protein
MLFLDSVTPSFARAVDTIELADSATASALSAQQLRQLGEVHRQPPRLVARQPIWSPSEPVGRTLTPNADAQEPRMTSANQLPTRRLVTSTEPGGIDKIAAALAIAEKLAGTFSACHSLLFTNTFVKFCVCQLSDTPLYLC